MSRVRPPLHKFNTETGGGPRSATERCRATLLGIGPNVSLKWRTRCVGGAARAAGIVSPDTLSRQLGRSDIPISREVGVRRCAKPNRCDEPPLLGFSADILGGETIL